jgi:hypothetical protein
VLPGIYPDMRHPCPPPLHSIKRLGFSAMEFAPTQTPNITNAKAFVIPLPPWRNRLWRLFWCPDSIGNVVLFPGGGPYRTAKHTLWSQPERIDPTRGH